MAGKRIHTVDILDLDPFADDPCVRRAIAAVGDTWEHAAGARLSDHTSRVLVEAALAAFVIAGGLGRLGRRHLEAHAGPVTPGRPFEADPSVAKAVEAVGSVWRLVMGVGLGDNARHCLTEAALVSFAIAGGLERPARKRLLAHVASLSEVAGSIGLRIPVASPAPIAGGL